MDDEEFIIINHTLHDYMGKKKRIEVPQGVIKIGYWAFGENDITRVVLPNSTTIIEISAFAYCDKMTDIYITESVTEIGDTAFEECYKINIHAPEGSYAESYAKENNIPFVAI